jgi:hypothetical protein
MTTRRRLAEIDAMHRRWEHLSVAEKIEVATARAEEVDGHHRLARLENLPVGHNHWRDILEQLAAQLRFEQAIKAVRS